MLDCIVIGAGPGGLVSTKELLEQGVKEVVCLEQAADLGGTFTKTYDSLVLTSSTTISMFSDFWIGDGNQEKFWTKAEAIDYWQRYAQHFGVMDHIRFNSKVVKVSSQADKSWQVSLESGESLSSQRIALAIGNNSIPNFPAWKDSLTKVEYFHSRNYRNADQFVGKNVVVVGGGESGSDIALETSRVASNSWVSLRSTTGWVTPRKRADKILPDNLLNRILWNIPRSLGPILTKAESSMVLTVFKDPINAKAVELCRKVESKRGIFGTYGTKTHAMPKAIVNHGCQVVGEIVKVEDGGRTLHTVDGKILTNVDVIVFATGYQNHVSFLPEELQQTDPRSLYKHMFHPQYRDRIAWIGWARPNFGSQFPIMEMQARLFALICQSQKSLPTPAAMNKIIRVDRATWLKQFEHNAHRIRSLVDYFRYMNDLAEVIGCKPPMSQYFFLQHRLWRKIMFGATQGIQFRLRGPGNKESTAREMLMKLPTGVPTPVLKEVLQQRAQAIAAAKMTSAETQVS